MLTINTDDIDLLQLQISVYDNNIKLTGAQAIAHALTKNTLLKSLNLRLNRLGDEGFYYLSKTLQILTLLKLYSIRFLIL